MTDPLIRHATPRDAQPLAALFRHAYGDTSHPCKDPAYLRRYLADARNILLVATEQGQLIASMGMTFHPWNCAYEWGLGVTSPAHRRAGLAETLMRQVFARAYTLQAGEIVFGYPRVRRIYDIGQTCVDPPQIATGHDGGANIANGQREYHLMIFARPSYARFTHVAPALARAEFVRERVYRPMGLPYAPGGYPEVCLASGLVGSPAHMADTALFQYNHDHQCPAGALEINAYRGAPERLRHDLAALLREFPAARHVCLSVLADKQRLIHELGQMGFAITAWLPAWHRDGAARYDCVRMVRRNFTEEPVVHGMEELLRGFQAGYAALQGELAISAEDTACIAN
ncbi:MAG: GNAT family N-acetyltransferase [Blastocatellia bacterium]